MAHSMILTSIGVGGGYQSPHPGNLPLNLHTHTHISVVFEIEKYTLDVLRTRQE